MAGRREATAARRVFGTGADSGGGASGINLGTTILVVAGGGGGGGAASLSAGGAGGDGGATDGSQGGGPFGGGAGGLLGGSSTPAGGTDFLGGTGAGGGGGGGFPNGGGAGSSCGITCGGGGGGGGRSYYDGNFFTLGTIGIGEPALNGSVEFRYTGPDASPLIYRCTGGIETFTAIPGDTAVRVTAIAGNGSFKRPEGSTSTFTKPGLGDGVAAVIPTYIGLAIDIGVGCGGQPGQWGGAGTDRSPGGAGGFGLHSGGDGGTGIGRSSIRAVRAVAPVGAAAEGRVACVTPSCKTSCSSPPAAVVPAATANRSSCSGPVAAPVATAASLQAPLAKGSVPVVAGR